MKQDRDYLNNLKIQMKEKKEVQQQKTFENKLAEKDSIDKEVLAFQHEEEERQAIERQKKMQYYNQLKGASNTQNPHFNSHHPVPPNPVALQNPSHISNNHLAMDPSLHTATSKRDQVMADRRHQSTSSLAFSNQPHVDARQAYQAIKHKQTAAKPYNLLTGV